jgi:cytochrome c oxidase subunit 4
MRGKASETHERNAIHFPAKVVVQTRHGTASSNRRGSIFAALIALTGLTVWLGSIDVGGWHTAISLTVAATKAALIGLFFMHLLQSSRVTWAIAGTSLLFLAILLVLTLTDYLSRDWQTGRAAGLSNKRTVREANLLAAETREPF